MKSRWVKIVLILLGVLVLLVAALPRLLSTGLIRGMALGQVNDRMPGSVAVEDWSLRWLGENRVTGIDLSLGEGQPAVTVEEVTVERGLLSLARNWQQAGTVQVQRPVVTLPLPAEPVVTEPVESPPSIPIPTTTPTTAPAQTPPAFVFPDVFATLEVTDALVRQRLAEGELETLLEDISLRVEVKGNREPVSVALALATPGSSGTLSVDAQAGPFGDQPVDPDTLPLDVNLKVDALDLGALMHTASAWAEVPEAKGILEGTFTVTGTRAEGLQVAGTLRSPSLQVAGGPLGTDRPDLGLVLLNLNTTVVGDSITVSNLLLRCAQAQFNASGSVGQTMDGTLTVQGRVDVPALTAALPATLKLQPGLTVTEGQVTLAATATRAGESIKLDASVSLPSIAGTRDGQPLAWDAPVEAAVKGSMTGEDWMIEQATVSAPFLDATGKGTLDDLAVRVNSDLASALVEIGKFVDLGDWSVAGRLDVTATAKEHTVGGRDVRLVATLQEGQVVQAQTVLMPRGTATVSFQGRVTEPGDQTPLSVDGGTVNWSSWVSAGTGTWDRVVVTPATESAPLGWSLDGLKAGLNVDLQAINGLLPKDVGAPPPPILGGQVKVSVVASGNDREVAVQSLTVVGEGLSVELQEQTYRESRIEVTTGGTLVLDGPEIALPMTTLTFSPGRLALTNLAVRAEAGTLRKLEVTGGAGVDLAKLMAALGESAPLAEGASVAGQAVADFQLSVSAETNVVVQLQTLVEGLTFKDPERTLLENETLRSTVNLTRDGATGRIRFDPVSVTSTPVTLKARGQAGGLPTAQEIDVKGDLAVDLATVSAYVKTLAGIDLSMEGTDERPFSFQAAWNPEAEETPMSKANLEAGLQIDRLQAFGMDVQDITLPLNMQQGVLDLALKASVNEGTLEVRPHLDFTEAQQTLVLLQPTNLLQGVQLTDALAHELLALIHPLFKNATGIAGTVDLGMLAFSWPLDPERRNDAAFSGEMKFSELRLATSGMLDKLLLAAKVKERNLELGEKTIRFACKDGRIEVSEMKIKAGEHHITLAGSMGLDQTLDYYAMIPVTEELVGRQYFKYLEGTTIRVPIRGPASKPEVGVNVIRDAVADLVKQAAQKAVKEQAGKLIEGLFK